MDTDRTAVRARIHMLAAAGHNPTEISARLGVCRQTVYRWKNGPRGCGFHDLERKGAPRKLTSHQEDALIAHAKSQRYDSFRKLAAWCQARGYPVGHGTVRRILKRRGIHAQKSAVPSELSQDHKRHRLYFCDRFRNFDWRTALFVSETKFPLHPTQSSHNAWHLTWKGAPPVSENGPYFSAWAGVSAHGVTDIHIFEGSLNPLYYKDILKVGCTDASRNLFHGSLWTLFQDENPAHTARRTQKWLKKQQFLYVPRDEWPANSPDLNPMETLWAHVKDKLKGHTFANLKQLKRAVAREWDKTSPAFCESLLLSLPHRMYVVRHRKGEHI